ncbi:HAD family phosphatase [Pedobacter heparinus]|uniref:HAD family hydrolase n=1 Tax=Pedobacter heparinus TaxID=984 RepID=UPI00292F4ABE|nr:HAD family phosphatase [Pedobacter heparinus]
MELSRFLKLRQLSEGDYQAFLYDCDGTLADNMPAHTATYIATANEYGVSIDPAMINELAGWPIADVVTEMNIRYQSNIDPIAFRARKAELYAAEYMEKIVPIDFVLQHLKASAGKVRIGVVSGGDREAIEKTLKVLGVDDLVEVLICAGDTLKGKPFPDPFLKAAALLHVEPGRCLVFEDGLPGVEAAKSAGMAWLRIDQIV